MSDTAREIFVKNLRFFMEEKGISQADICRELKVSSATVSDWCSGKKYPRIDAMQRLAELLGVTFSMLTTENGVIDYQNMDRLEALHQNPKLGMLFDKSRKMDNRDINHMLELADIILRSQGKDD